MMFHIFYTPETLSAARRVTLDLGGKKSEQNYWSSDKRQNLTYSLYCFFFFLFSIVINISNLL